MTTFDLGSGIRCDLPNLIDTRLLIQASSGGGKSWAIRRILEQTHGKVQQLVIDPESEFHTLREKYDYVYAAPHGGDTVAHPRSAALLAERLLELGASAILDIFELKPEPRRAFVKLFCEALVEIPKRLYHPVLVIVDEGHVFAPQGQECESTAAIVDLAARGRKRGQCLILATQRISKLSKDAAAELKNRMIGGTFLDLDRKRAGDEMGIDRDGALALRELKPGQFWTFGPAFPKAHAPTLLTVGSVETTHPKPGAKLDAPVPPTPERIRALLPKLADLPAEAEQRARTEKELKQDLAEARRKITLLERGAPARVETKVETKVVEVPILSQDDLKEWRLVNARTEDRVRTLLEQLPEIGQTYQRLTEQLERAATAGPDPVTTRAIRHLQAQHKTAVRPVKPKAEQRVHAPVDGELTGPEQRILNALAWLDTVGVSPAENTAVAFLARYRPNGGAYLNPRGRLNQRGLLRYRDGCLELTDEGSALAEWPDAPGTAESLQEMVLKRLPGPEQRILAPLLEVYPKGLGNDDLAAAAGYAPTGGAYQNPRGRLRTLGLVEYADGQVRARPLLFLE
jgi:hypothetical protein